MSATNEKNLALRGHSVSSAASRLTDLATEMDYNAVATGPRTYQLVRQRRRRLLGKRIEMMTISLIEDRSGTRARIIGDIDELFLQHLGGTDVADDVHERSGRSAPPVGGDQSGAGAPAPAARRVDIPVQQPARDRSAVRPSAAPTGMIAEVPGAKRRPAEQSAPRRPSEQPAVVSRIIQPVEPSAVSHDESEHTVMRSRVGPAPVASSVPALHAANGLRHELRGIVIIGRNPDAIGLTGATPMAIDDRSISKTHASVEIIGDRLVVVDLHSSNGTWIDVEDQTLACEPGSRIEVPVAPCTLRFGDARVEVRVPA